MKRFVVMMVCLALLCCASALAETVSVCGIKADSTSTALDFSSAKQDYSALASRLSRFPKLQTVRLGKTTLSADELLKLMKKYAKVTFSYSLKVYGVWTAHDATEIDAGKTVIRDADKMAQYLRCLPKLTKVTAYGTVFGKPAIKMLTETFPNIDFHVTLALYEHRVRTDATAFSTLHGETSQRHTDFTILAYCKQLRAIDLGHNSVSDLSFLRALPHMRMLVMPDNNISDISALAELKELEYIELFINSITDISPLAQCENLLDVSLVNNKISDISPLASCKKLQRAWLGRNAVTAAQAKKLRKALPACNVNITVKDGTGDNWRLHPRHKFKRASFEGGAYVPFDEASLKAQ